jgi:hypothetical protein
LLSDKKKVYNVILEKEVKDKINTIAMENERSFSNMVNLILKEYLRLLDLDKNKL